LAAGALDILQNNTGVIIGAVGSVVGVLPFLSPVKDVIQLLGQNIQTVKYCQRQLEFLKTKCDRYYDLLVVKLSPRIAERYGERNEFLQPLVSRITDINTYIRKFQDKGLISKYITMPTKIREEIEMLEKQLDLEMNSIHLQLTQETFNYQRPDAEIAQMRAQYSSLEAGMIQLQQQQQLLQQQGGGGRLTLGENDFKMIAEAIGCPDPEVLKGELDSIRSLIKETEEKLTAKQEELSQKYVKVSEDTAETQRQLERDRLRVEKETSEINYALKSVLQSTTVIYSSTKEIEYHELRSSVLTAKQTRFQVVLIHSDGIGVASFHSIDGIHGRDGFSYSTLAMAYSGSSGSPGRDGGHGMSGSSGQDGTDGTSGDAGRNCENFDVSLSLIGKSSERKRKYRVVVTRRGSVIEEEVEVNYPNCRFFINGRGGHGGNG
jgi:Skp family chaperone for outer membrane proteins